MCDMEKQLSAQISDFCAASPALAALRSRALIQNAGTELVFPELRLGCLNLPRFFVPSPASTHNHITSFRQIVSKQPSHSLFFLFFIFFFFCWCEFMRALRSTTDQELNSHTIYAHALFSITSRRFLSCANSLWFIAAEISFVNISVSCLDLSRILKNNNYVFLL